MTGVGGRRRKGKQSEGSNRGFGKGEENVGRDAGHGFGRQDQKT